MQYDTEYNVLGVHTVGWTIAYCKYFLVHCTSLCVWHRVYNCAILRSWYSTSTWYAYVQYTYLAEGSRRTGTVHYIHDPKDFWCQKAEIQSREQWSNMCLQLLGSVFANTASYCIMHTMIPGMSSYILGVHSNLSNGHTCTPSYKYFWSGGRSGSVNCLHLFFRFQQFSPEENLRKMHASPSSAIESMLWSFSTRLRRSFEDNLSLTMHSLIWVAHHRVHYL